MVISRHQAIITIIINQHWFRLMARCLTAPSHYLKQCWLVISKTEWHSSEGNFTRDTSAISHYNSLQISYLKLYQNLTRATISTSLSFAMKTPDWHDHYKYWQQHWHHQWKYGMLGFLQSAFIQTNSKCKKISYIHIYPSFTHFTCFLVSLFRSMAQR